MRALTMTCQECETIRVRDAVVLKKMPSFAREQATVASRALGRDMQQRRRYRPPLESRGTFKKARRARSAASRTSGVVSRVARSMACTVAESVAG